MRREHKRSFFSRSLEKPESGRNHLCRLMVKRCDCLAMLNVEGMNESIADKQEVLALRRYIDRHMAGGVAVSCECCDTGHNVCILVHDEIASIADRREISSGEREYSLLKILINC